MPDYDFVPGFAGIGQVVGGVPYNPAGPAFAADFLNPIMKSGAATHWTTLTSNLTATVAEHGRGFRLSGFTLALNPAADLQKGWRAFVVGPGTIDPQDGPTAVIVANEWAILGSDGTSTIVLRSGAGGQFNLDPVGEWSALVAYSAMQAVSKSGGSYVSLQDANTNNDPEVSPSWWMVLAVPQTPPVVSVNAQTGAVVLDGADLVFDPTGTSLAAVSVDAAVRELDADVAAKLDDSQLSDDTTLGGGGASATVIPSQHAVKVYADQILSAMNAIVLVGTIDASTNPNYPAADKGSEYVITVAGKIGGAAGADVEPGDTILCLTDGTVTGDHATVGANWTIIQANLVSAVLGPASSTTNRIAAFADGTGRVLKDSGILYTDIALLSDLLLRKGEVVLTAAAAVLVADLGKLHVYNGAADGDVTLPAAATAGAGGAILLSVTGVGDATLKVTGDAAFDDGTTSVILNAGQSLLAESNGTTWRLLLRGGGAAATGGVVMREEIFVSAGETSKVLTDTPLGEEYVWFTYGPLSQNKDTFALAAKTLTFSAIPAGTEYTVKYMTAVGQVGGDEVWGEDVGTGTTMTLSEAPATFNSLTVMVGLVELPKDNVAYTLSGTTVTLSSYDTSMGRRTYKISKALPIATPAAESVGLIQLKSEVFSEFRSQPFTFKNLVDNGSMRFAQRGTSFTAASNPANNDARSLIDRWILLSDGNDIVDVTQETSVIPTNGKYAMALDVETVNKKFGILQIFPAEDCVGAIGQTVTLSFQAKVSAVTKLDNLKAAIVTWSGTADSPTVDIVSAWGIEGTDPTLVANWTYENTPANLNPTTSYATYSVSGAVDTASAKNIGVFIWSDVTDTTLGDFLYVTDVQLEVGAAATAFERKPYEHEFTACQRFVQDIVRGNGSSGSVVGDFVGQKVGTTAIIDMTVKFPVKMFKAPVLVHSTPTWLNANPTTGNQIAWYGNGGTNFSAAVGALTLSFSSAGKTGALFRCQAATSFAGNSGEVGNLYISPNMYAYADAEFGS